MSDSGTSVKSDNVLNKNAEQAQRRIERDHAASPESQQFRTQPHASGVHASPVRMPLFRR